MNPGGHLSRHKGLDRGDSTLARTEWRTPKDRKPGKAKRRKPTESLSESNARRLVRKRSGGDCEVRIPDHCQGRATNFQHRWAEGQGGPWTASNGLDVCGWGNYSGCHGYIHQHPDEAKKHGWTIYPGKDVAPAKVAVLLHTAKCGHDDVLLDDKGGVTLAPWPEHPDIHPDDLDVPKPTHEAGEAA